MKQHEYINSYCVGCGMCQSAGKKKLEIIERGFPNSALSNDDDLQFYKNVCPIYYYDENVKHDVWGIVDKAYVTYSADPDVRFKAASGGALTEICVYLLENKFVDGIIHTTYNPERPTENISCISYSAEQIKTRCGSRYSISVPLMEILQIVDRTKKYAFVGKPCDVMALRRYLATDSEMNGVVCYLLSFFCAGEPSVDAQKALLEKMGSSLEDCKEITYRGNGWPGFTTVKKSDSSEVKLEYNISWGKYLGRDLRNICRFCMDGTGDAADIVCADFWVLTNEGKPDFSEHEGRNIAISRTEKGSKVLDGCVNSGRLIKEEDFTEKMEEFYKYQPHQFRRKNTMSSMISAMKLCGRQTPKYSKSYLTAYAKHSTSKQKRDAFIGVIKRVIKGRL